MSPKKFLSEKKTSAQTISISPALKDWIESYVKKMREEHPEDERYKSTSAFFCEVMENALQIFEKGKTLDDFKDFVDSGIKQIWNKFLMKANIPRWESIAEVSKYYDSSIDSFISFLIAMQKNYTRAQEAPIHVAIKNYFDRMKNFWHPKNVIEYVNIEFSNFQNRKKFEGIFEIKGKLKNIHYENCKGNALVIGMIGGKITNVIYSEIDKYARFDLETTDLLFSTEPRLKERKRLMKYNLSFFTNYARIIKDNDFHLWMRLAEDDDVFLSFKSEITFNKWLKKIRDDIDVFDDDNLLLSILRIFERIHWIQKDNENDLKFQIKLPENEYKKERKYLLDYLSKYSRIEEKNGVYHLKEGVISK